MALPFTAEQFYGVFPDYNAAGWPMQWILMALALSAALGLVAAGRVGFALLLPLGSPLRTRTS